MTDQHQGRYHSITQSLNLPLTVRLNVCGGSSSTTNLPHSTVARRDKLLDLDLALIEDAYQAEYVARQQRVERMAAIRQVGGGMAHELRNPLNVIKTSVYFLLNARNATPEKRAEHPAIIGTECRLRGGDRKSSGYACRNCSECCALLESSPNTLRRPFLDGCLARVIPLIGTQTSERTRHTQIGSTGDLRS